MYWVCFLAIFQPASLKKVCASDLLLINQCLKSIGIKKIKSIWHKTNRNQNGRYFSPSANHHSCCRRGGGGIFSSHFLFLLSIRVYTKRAWKGVDKGRGEFPLFNPPGKPSRKGEGGSGESGERGMGYGSDRFHSFSKR